MSNQPAREEIDLGDGHRLVFAEYQGEQRVGGNVVHPPVDGKCDGQGWIAFSGKSWAKDFAAAGKPIATWDIAQEEPLTLSPSILCRACGDHGFIREGKWVRA